jgi:hypothetical protein
VSRGRDGGVGGGAERGEEGGHGGHTFWKMALDCQFHCFCNALSSILRAPPSAVFHSHSLGLLLHFWPFAPLQIKLPTGSAIYLAAGHLHPIADAVCALSHNISW